MPYLFEPELPFPFRPFTKLSMPLRSLELFSCSEFFDFFELPSLSSELGLFVDLSMALKAEVSPPTAGLSTAAAAVIAFA